MNDEEKGDPFRMRVQSLNAHNYYVWSNEMEILLRGKGLWQFVCEPDASDDGSNENSRKRDLALAYLMMSIDASCKGSVMTLRNPFEVWQKLKASYQAVSEAAIDAKLTKLQQMRMDPEEPVMKYTNKIENLVNELAAAGHPISSLEKKRALLRGLREEFSVVAQVIRTTGKDYDEAVSQLIIHESSMNIDSPQEATALITPHAKTRNWKRGKKCFHCGRKGHLKHECWLNPESKKFKGKNWKRKCVQENSKDQGDDKKANNEKKNDIAFLTTAMTVKQSNNSSKWMVDCACTRHICNDKDSFTTLVCSQDSVQVGNKEELSAHGYGSVTLTSVVNGVTFNLELHDVLYCPEMMYNLISSSETRKKGLRTEIDNHEDDPSKGLLKIIHKESGNVCLLALETKEGLYEADISVRKPKKALSSILKMDSVWHARLGHISDDRIHHTAFHVDGIDEAELPKMLKGCESCALGKSTRHARKPRDVANSIARSPLKRVYTDVVGPISVPTLGGAKYFVTLLDEYSGYSMVKFIKKKDAAADHVKDMIISMETLLNAHVETLLDLKRKRVNWLRSDGGGEYVGSSFGNWMKNKGIHHEITTSYSPESNGRAERLNRTLIDMARSMMIRLNGNMTERLWGEAINTANYIRNRVVTRSSREQKTPYEIIFGKRPDVSNLRIFGCAAYVHIPKQKLAGKFAARAEEGILVGYCKGNAYRIYLNKSGKVVFSQDVDFNEDKFPTVGVVSEKSSFMSFEINSLEEEFVRNDFITDETGVPDEQENAREVCTEVQDVLRDSASEQPATFTTKDTDSSNEVDEGEAENMDDLTYHPNLRRSTRQTAGVPPQRFDFSNVCLVTEVLLSIESVEAPFSYEEAMDSSDKDSWTRAMSEEFEALNTKCVWSLVPLPAHRKPIKTRWVYDVKYGSDEKVMRRKARLVAKGFSQKVGVDYFEVFAPVCRYTTARFVIALSAYHRWIRVQLDVKTAFLNAALDEEIYVEQPQGFEVVGKEEFVYVLHKALYGLKQAARLWHHTLEKFLTSNNFTISWADPSLFMHWNSGLVVLVIIYVDDIMITGNDEPFMKEFISTLKKTFMVRDCQGTGKFLGISIEEKDGFVKLHHDGMIQRILKFFGMSECIPSSVPLPKGTDLFASNAGSVNCKDEKPFQQLVGALLHLSNTTRPDISYAAAYLARHMQQPTVAAWHAAKGVLRYLRGTSSLGLCFSRLKKGIICGFSDSDWAQERPERKSIGGFIFSFAGGAISWKSRKQSVVAQSSVEAEYIALADAVREALWLRKFMKPAGIPRGVFDISIREDNQGCIALSNDRIVNEKSKHIDVRHQLVVDHVRKGIINVVYVRTSDNVADLMTKALHKATFERLRELLGMRV